MLVGGEGGGGRRICGGGGCGAGGRRLVYGGGIKSGGWRTFRYLR